MKFTILTQYYPPETGAPQNRLSDLATQLRNAGFEVVVITAMPNYPKNEIFKSYKGKLFVAETIQDITIYRSWIFVGKSRSVIPRLLNYFSFVITSFFTGLIKLKRQDFILCESPPLFLGISGLLLSVFKKSKFIFNISDLWPESAEKLGVIKNKRILKLTEKLECYLYRKSYLITGQTQGIIQNIAHRTGLQNLHWLPNGLSDDILNLNSSKSSSRERINVAPNKFLLSYTGVIGHAQGLELILQVAKELMSFPDIALIICGDGPELNHLIKMASDLHINNLSFTGALSKDEALQIVMASDAAIIPLKKIDLFQGAIPSKIFENAALQKPLLLGVEGEAKELFIDKAQAGLFFEPENCLALKQAILTLYHNPQLCEKLGQNGKAFVIDHFLRKNIATEFIHKISQQSFN